MYSARERAASLGTITYWMKLRAFKNALNKTLKKQTGKSVTELFPKGQERKEFYDRILNDHRIQGKIPSQEYAEYAYYEKLKKVDLQGYL